MYIFPIRVKNGDDILKYIFPSKQKAVQKVIELAKMDSRIKRVFVFGSAITMKCNMKSDLDIALDVDEMEMDEFAKLASPFFTSVLSEIDVVYYNKINNNLLKKNIDDGICVYEKW